MVRDRQVHVASNSNRNRQGHVSFDSETNFNPSKKALEKLKKKKESLYGVDIAQKLIKEGIFTDLASHLASLPKQISTIIAERANAMLEIVTIIQTKSTPLSLFGTKVKKTNGEEVDYTPKCLRDHMKTNPVSGSNCIKEEDGYKTIVSQFDDLIKKFSEDGTNLLKQCAEHEVSKRKELLKTEALQAIADISCTLVILERRKLATPNNAGPNLSNKALGWKTALSYINTFTAARRTQLYFASSAEVGPLFEVLKEKADVRIGNTELNDIDNSIINAVKEKVSTLFPLMSFDVWDTLGEDELVCTVNQDLIVEQTKKKQGAVNEEAQDTVMGAVGVDESTMRSFACQEALSIFTSQQKKQQRAKYSGDPKNQGSPSTKAGLNSSKGRGNSNADARKPGKGQTKEKSVKKKQHQRKHKQQQNPKQPNAQQKQPKKKQRGGKVRGDQGVVPSVKRGKQRQRR
eukprot:scaffold43841_cov43-Cyclotella_meneghiniana.AAC.1